MLSKKALYVMLSIVVVLMLILSAIIILRPSQDEGTKYYNDGMSELAKGNYRTASGLFWKAYGAYNATGERTEAANALHKKFICDRSVAEYPYNRSEAVNQVWNKYKQLSNETIERMLDEEQAERIFTDGEYLYFSDVASNMGFRNLTLLHQQFEKMGQTPIYDTLKPLVYASQGEHRTYFNLTDFISTGGVTFPRAELPGTGILKVWLPAPINTDSQINIGAELSFPGQVISTTVPGGEAGMYYLEIDLATVQQDVRIEFNYTFSEYQMKFEVDPDNIGEYDRTSALYTEFTSSHGNILVTPEIQALAKDIVGEEDNPYLQAKLVYQHVLGNITYSFVPHGSLVARSIAESEYVRINGFGDCGAQSIYFSALMRSLGVPARAIGGYQSFPPGSGTHFWAEFYLPNYGWVPVDVTAAETADWSYNANETEKAVFKEFFFGNLDPYRMVIQVDMDLPAIPSTGDSVQHTICFQFPAIVCEGSTKDLAMYAIGIWSLSVRQA